MYILFHYFSFKWYIINWQKSFFAIAQGIFNYFMKKLLFSKTKSIFIAVATLLITFSFLPAQSNFNKNPFAPQVAEAGLQEDLNKVQQKLAQLKKDKQDLQNKINNEKTLQGQYANEINRLSDEVELLDMQIVEKQLKIDELELTIKILEADIEKTESDIIDSETVIDSLEDETDSRLAQMYVEQKVISSDLSIVFTAGSSENFLKNAQYKKSLQEETNKNLELLENKKADLEVKKTDLENDQIQIKKDKTLLDEEKAALQRDAQSFAQQKSYYSLLLDKSQDNVNASKQVLGTLSEEEQKLLAQQEYLKQQIFNSITKINSNQYVVKGTAIGIEGCTGICTGAHLHFAVQYNGGWRNPCDALPIKTLKNAVCGTGSPIIAQWPMGGTPWLTSGYRTSSRPTHNAIDISSGGAAIIYAAHDGWIQYGNDGACANYKGVYPCNGKGSNYAKICSDKNNCSNGLSTMYFHLRD